jgi:16S rRNA (guanine527-N7)-methyltransferase
VRFLDRAGIRLDSSQLDRLWTYHNLLRMRNEGYELTRLVGFESIVVKHYVDSMIVSDFIELPSPLIDVGTGAGFPGIPLKILLPRLELVLAEPRAKRVAFLREAILTLGLDRTEVFPHKVVSRSFTRPMAAAITRAVETIDKTILRTSGCLGAGGRIIFLKGPSVDPEIKEAHRRFGDAIELELDKHYRLAGTTFQRRLVVFRRTRSSLSDRNSLGDDEGANE